jgi:hypothetical protein
MSDRVQAAAVTAADRAMARQVRRSCLEGGGWDRLEEAIALALATVRADSYRAGIAEGFRVEVAGRIVEYTTPPINRIPPHQR